MFFWNSLAFSMIQWMLAIWSLVPLPFLNPTWTSGSSWFMYCWNLAWRILSTTFLACERCQQLKGGWLNTTDTQQNLRNLCAGQEATVRTRHGTMDWFHIGKRVCQGCILSPCLFNFSAENMWNAQLDESQSGIKIAGRNINNLRYADISNGRK